MTSIQLMHLLFITGVNAQLMAVAMLKSSILELRICSMVFCVGCMPRSIAPFVCGDHGRLLGRL